MSNKQKVASVIREQTHRALVALRLPVDIVPLLRSNRLEAEVLKAQERNEYWNRMLDAWEEANPAAYRASPWYASREKWKAAGRPMPPWYELLGEQTAGRRVGTGLKVTPLAAYELRGFLADKQKRSKRQQRQKQAKKKAKEESST